MMSDWTFMAGYGLGHWILFAATVAAIVYPIGRVLARIGFSPYWSVLAVIPLANLIGLWLLAFINWPARRASGS